MRTLHHYDEIGLLSPRGRSEAGYRLYAREDLERLREILMWRALGFSLAEIAELLEDAAQDRIGALRRQRELVQRDLDRLGSIARAIDLALDAHRNGTVLEEVSMFEGFDPSEYEDEARERWGHTDAYRESARRAKTYGEREWDEIRAESEQIVAGFAALFRAGEPATAQAAGEVAERHRRQISRWFYPCSHEMHCGVAEMYIADPRFAASYDRVQDGLAGFVHDAILAAGAASGAGSASPP
ncbi:MAG: MerR family transcriptional regulator [Actinomycetota bacterium]|nr:MerR family transcriptional regulator [Actinomycetota bacterium]